MRERLLITIEAVVGYLVPIACREHVLGDLRERNNTLAGYALDAARVMPYAIWSRILRTTSPRLLLLQGAVVFASFLAAAIASGPEYFAGPLPFIRLAIPAAAGLLGLVVADAYRDDTGPGDDVQQAIRRIRPIQWGFVAGGATQVVLFIAQPAWFLPPKITLWASVLIWLLLIAVRALAARGPAVSGFTTAHSASTLGSAHEPAPAEARQALCRLLCVYGIFGAGAVYFLNGGGRLPWLVVSAVSFYSAFRVYRLPERSPVAGFQRLALGRRLFLGWVSVPVVSTLIAAALTNPLKHPDQHELLLRAVPVVALSLIWFWSAWKRSSGPA